MAEPPLPAMNPGGSTPAPRMERCLLGKEMIMLPEALNGQTSIFEHVMSLDMWNTVLDDEERKRLKALLPSFPEEADTETEKEETIKRLFGGENFKFGNPLQQFHQKMKDGKLSPEIARCNSLLRKFKKREYKFSQQNHCSQLLNEVLLSRERTMNMRNGLPPDVPLPFRHAPKRDSKKALKTRVNKNYNRILKEAREECNLEDTSSEEEETINPVQRSKRQLHRSLGPIPSPEPTTPSVVATFANKPSILNGDISGTDSVKRPRALSPVEITDEHYRQMLKRHKRRKVEDPGIPELDTADITLQDILSRCQASKKANKIVAATNGEAGPEVGSQATPAAKKKQRVREKGEKKLKRKVTTVKVEPAEVGEGPLSLQPTSANLDVHSDLLTHRDDDGVPDFPLPDTLPQRLTMGQADNFFSLLRDIICDFPDTKATTAKLEERVREWQESPASALNSWVHFQQNWVECVVSALKFLSGDVLGLSVENFVPFLDYKERAQQWKWIGAGRDANPQLSPLSRHWLKHRSTAPVDGLSSSQGSPPPVRTKTNFVVRPTTTAEKALYQEQEHRRFDNPHRAFTYHLHGYDSVVGPVKGVYNKENAVTKAREHNLLVSDRPAFVTILTLVRDAAARLPNGEGTRGDICELLKDSQFLAPGVTDTQINTVVSGALDRLHSEKDPCVKYDVNSKLWIYLHRSRTEEEFERIHQAQGAAAKAKKSLQRPKTSKAIKDHMSQSTTASVKAALAQNMAAAASNSGELKMDSITSLMGTSSPVGQSAKTLSEASPASQARSSKAKQAAAARSAAAAAAAAAAATAAAASTTIPAPTATPSIATPSRKASAKSQHASVSKSRTPVVSVTASAAASLLGSRAQSTGLGGVAHNGSLLAGLGKAASPLTGTKPPVVTVTKQGLTPGSKVGGNSPAARQSPIILTQDPGSRSSTPTTVTVATPPPTGKLVTLAQTSGIGSAGVVVTGTADNAMITRLVQQVAGGQQVVSVGNLPTGSLAQVTGQQRGTTLKIQGGSIVQPMVGGKPVRLSGKPLLQLGGKGGQPLSVIQTSQGQISTLSLIPQALSTTAQLTSVASKTANSTSGTSSPVTLTMVGSTPHSKAAVLASSGATTLSAQAKVVTPSQAGMVVTQLAPGISLRPGLAGTSQAKMMAAGQAGLVPAQFIVQQAPNSSQAGAQGTPMVVSQAGKGGQQNIQVVRTVLSQQGLKPGQATILISQPALQQAAAASGSVISSAQVIHTAGASPGGPGKVTGRGSPKGKAQPVYARIITPPPGMKLTTVGPGQVQGPGGMLQTVGKLLAGLPTTVGGGGITIPSCVTMTIPSSSASPAVVVATTQSLSAGQSLLKSQPSDSSDTSNTDSQT
ncbi:hypothetical protein V1264_004618 [Littorina saxatilis]|uniref:DEUBAD domain-containing protein n=1 Tax=Littorina saxatilis TaxID=31220 RepID=A0AAN9B4J6_9CAEN